MIDPVSQPTPVRDAAPLRRLQRSTAPMPALSGEQVQVSTARPNPAALAKSLHEATRGRAMTDEAAIFRVLRQLRSPAEAQQLDKAFKALTGKSVDSILKAELSGTQLSRAQSLFQKQTIDWNAHGALAYRAEGAMTALDDLGTTIRERPLTTAAVVGVGIVASLRAPALMSSLGIAGAAWQAGQVIRTEGQAWSAADPATKAQRQIRAGKAWGELALNMPGLRGDVKRVRQATQAARTVAKSEGAVSAVKTFVDHGRVLGRMRLKPIPLSEKAAKLAPGPNASLKDALKNLDGVQEPSAVLAKDMIDSYKKLTPVKRTEALNHAFEALSPAARKRALETLKDLAKDRVQGDALKTFVESPDFLKAPDNAKFKLLAKWAAREPEQIASSLLVAMGTGHVKIGQIVADAPFMPESFAAALKKLQKDAPAMPDDKVAAMMAKAGMDQRYDVGKLLGVGSVGQVHLGTDKQTGAQVVVKLLKPGVEPTEIKQEFAFMEAYLKPYLDNVHPEKARYMRDNLNSFRDGIIAEIDFAQEAENIATFAKAYPDNPGFTGIEALVVSDNKTVLIMNPAKGVDFKKLETLPPEQRSQAAEKYAHAIYEQIFGEKHYFHADPHPGNVKFDPESGKVVFLDLGATATISTDDMRELYRALGFLVARDSKGLANFYVDNAANISSTLSKTELRAALRQDIQAMFDKPGFTASFLIESVKDINDIATRHGVWPKAGNTWLTKTLFTANNVFYKTDVSGGNLSSIGMPYIVKGMAAAYKQNPKAWQGTFLQVAGTLGKSPVTVAKSILELSRINPAVLDGVPQGMLTAIRAMAISGGISGETAPGAAQK